MTAPLPLAADLPVPDLPPGYCLEIFDRLDSSNSQARTLAASGAADKTLVWAREQLSGRGRQGRQWSSPPGNLYLSQVVKTDLPVAQLPLFGFVAALAIADMARHLLSPYRAMVDIHLKWPNDVLINGGKLAGILIESTELPSGTGTAQSQLIVGTGINIASAPDLPDRKTTALNAVAGRDIMVSEALVCFVHRWQTWRQCLEKEGFAPLRTAWLDQTCPPGTVLSVRQNKAHINGLFRDLADDGSLLLETAQGVIQSVRFGDVSMPDAHLSGGQ